MQLEVKVEELRKNKLFVATPMYGGMAHGMYIKSCLDLQAMCSQYGIEVRFSFIFNESLITRARNYLVDEFLRAEGFTHLLFIDADIHYDPRDVVACLALNKEIVGGPYPKKSIKWGSVKEAIKRHPNIEIPEIEKVAGDFVFNPVPGTEKFSVAEPIEVLEIGTGFMMVKREVFDKFREAYPEFSYRPDHVGQANFDGTRYIHAYFDTVIDRRRKVMMNGEEREVGGSDRYLSEDYMFCQWWRNLGGKIWMCPWMKTHHIGTYAFTGDMPAVANYVGSL
jgi:hypothetical protein